ncbi:MAG: pitrilysin family protein [Pyrinomonadaceae bacterium]
MKNSKFKIRNFLSVLGLLGVLCSANFAQETPPQPSAPKTVSIPAVKENKLPNGLTVAVVERKNVPLVTVQLLIRNGASSEDMSKAGLANMTATLLTKGTKTRSATQIAEQMEFLGGSINTGAGWSNSVVTVNVMSDKLDQAMTILSDVVMNPSFKQDEIDLLKSQTLDNLNFNLQKPGFLADYVASKYSFGEHPAGGTPKSINAVTRNDIIDFRQNSYTADNAVLIFAGDITTVKANALARKFFGTWKKSAKTTTGIGMTSETNNRNRRILVIDLPDSGQAAVKYLKDVKVGRVSSGNTSGVFYPAIVLNSLLGGGYSSRLNQEIRIKRGLSYGAGSGFSWRSDESNFATSTQTKNESAAEVVKLVLDEIDKLAENSIAATELSPRKLVLTGDFGRDLETTQGLAGALADLYSFGLPAGELNNYMKSVQAISDTQIRGFAKQNLLGGDIIVVGDYAKFKDDLKTRFPNMTVEVVKAAELDLDTIR